LAVKSVLSYAVLIHSQLRTNFRTRDFRPTLTALVIVSCEGAPVRQHVAQPGELPVEGLMLDPDQLLVLISGERTIHPA